jgi:hypothetical protein
MSLKLFLGLLSLVPAAIAYTIYFRALFAGRVKPHVFSWLIWGVLAGNGFIAQVSANAGIGAWATGVTSAACLTIFAVALSKGDTRLLRLDWILLSLAALAFVLLFVVDDPTISLCITLFATLLGFSMTLRKAYHLPHEENAQAFFLNAIKFLPAIFAVNTFSFLTIAYPITALLANASVAAVILARKNIVTR